MKKVYTAHKANIELFETKDVITASFLLLPNHTGNTVANDNVVRVDLDEATWN